MAAGLCGLVNCLPKMSTSICRYNPLLFKINSPLLFLMFIISYQQPQGENLLKMEKATKKPLGARLQCFDKIGNSKVQTYQFKFLKQMKQFA